MGGNPKFKLDRSTSAPRDTGRVRAEARVVSLSAEARVTDARSRVLAHGTSTLTVVDEGRDRKREAIQT
jgi:hypothetical protein